MNIHKPIESWETQRENASAPRPGNSVPTKGMAWRIGAGDGCHNRFMILVASGRYLRREMIGILRHVDENEIKKFLISDPTIGRLILRVSHLIILDLIWVIQDKQYLNEGEKKWDDNLEFMTFLGRIGLCVYTQGDDLCTFPLGKTAVDWEIFWGIWWGNRTQRGWHIHWVWCKKVSGNHLYPLVMCYRVSIW